MLLRTRVNRPRDSESRKTLKRQIDVAAAFAACDRGFPPVDPPTRPAVRELVPLDAVPVLVLERAELPWSDLGQLATELLLRVDGKASAMHLITGNAFPPSDCASELAVLARRGLVRLRSPADVEADRLSSPALEIDLTAV